CVDQIKMRLACLVREGEPCGELLVGFDRRAVVVRVEALFGFLIKNFGARLLQLTILVGAARGQSQQRHKHCDYGAAHRTGEGHSEGPLSFGNAPCNSGKYSESPACTSDR